MHTSESKRSKKSWRTTGGRILSEVARLSVRRLVRSKGHEVVQTWASESESGSGKGGMTVDLRVVPRPVGL